MCLFPERRHELHEIDRLLGVEDHGLAVGLDLLAAPGPEVGIAERRRITEGVPERLAERAALGLELLAGIPIGFPGVREGLVANLLEPGFAVGDLRAEHAPWNGNPFLAVVGDDRGLLVEALLRLGDLFGEVAHVGDTLGIELRPVVEAADDVGSRARLDRGGCARLDVVAVDGLEGELDAERFFAGRNDLFAQQLIGCGYEVVPSQPVDRGRLRVGRRPAGRENGRNSSGPRRDRAGTGELQELAACYAGHGVSPGSLDCFWRQQYVAQAMQSVTSRRWCSSV